jgi:hypothetical protein
VLCCDVADWLPPPLSPRWTWPYILEGFSDSDHLWELHRALYGLKTSPLLWYKEFTKTLTELGLEPVKDAPCLWKNDKLLVFFYVDDIVLLAKPAHTAALYNFER